MTLEAGRLLGQVEELQAWDDVFVQGNAGGTDQSLASLKSLVPPETSARPKSTSPPENSAARKLISPPENLAWKNLTVLLENSALLHALRFECLLGIPAGGAAAEILRNYRGDQGENAGARRGDLRAHERNLLQTAAPVLRFARFGNLSMQTRCRTVNEGR
jgi:hypothetical protein